MNTKSQSILDQAEAILGPIISPRQPIEMVELSYAGLTATEQVFAIHWLQVISVSNIELAYVFSTEIGAARKRLDITGVEQWLRGALSIYDQEGLYPAVKVLRDIEAFSRYYDRQAYTCYLRDVKPHLDTYIRGLAGRSLALTPGSEVYTDTECLYLPDQISRYRDKKQNAALYKSMACFLWAQTWYGTFRKQGLKSRTTQQRLDIYEDKNSARKYFLVLENVRLLAHIRHDLPGLYREMVSLSPLLVPIQDNTWKAITVRLDEYGSSVEDTFTALAKLMRIKCPVIPETDYQGSLKLDEVEASMEVRNQQNIKGIEQLKQKQEITQSDIEKALNASLSPSPVPNTENGDCSDSDETGEVSVDGMNGGGAGNEQLQRLIDSMFQDMDFDDDLLNILLNSELSKDDEIDSTQQGGGNSAGGDQNSAGECGILPITSMQIDEWDYLRHSYRRNWCQVRIQEIREGNTRFKQETQQKYPFLISQIRKIFEAMRDQPRFANRQTDGDDIDLDAVVDMYTARRAGEELTERLYIRRMNDERSVAVCLLVDMSGSTKGWINLAMRESLILFSEALNTLGDQYAILGFSGLTRQRCEIYNVKTFSDTQSDCINNRIANIQARDYTRMGFAVRYATQALMKTEARHRILLMLSDGKPDDYDGYQGEYGIRDTRKALLEAQGLAINPYSITIDKHAQNYLPRLFGPGQYMILDDVKQLPLKLSEVYRKLSHA